ncbi:MAG: hypothetical protein ABFS09_02835 [Thermodesulfobacteriota bacterium]
MDNRNLKIFRKTSISLYLLVFICFFLLPVQLSWAEDQEDVLSINGVVKEILLIERSLIVKPKEGKRHKIVFTEQTVFKGVAGAGNIEVKQKVRIWYVRENDLLKALKIKVMPELGC